MTSPTAPCLRLASHPVQKVPQRFHLLLKQILAGIALDDNRLVEQEDAILSVVAPDASALRKGGGPAEQRAQHLQCLVDPVRLIDGLVASILTRDEEHEQCRCSLTGTQCAREIRHGEDLPFLTRQYRTFCPESQMKRSPTLARPIRSCDKRSHPAARPGRLRSRSPGPVVGRPGPRAGGESADGSGPPARRHQQSASTRPEVPGTVKPGRVTK